MFEPKFPEMETNAIDFYSEDVDFEPGQPDALRDWIFDVIQKEGGQLGFIQYVFCSDEYLHQINLDFLQHDTYTDIITFPYSEEQIESDIFISIDRIKENAQVFGVTFEEELHRVMVHGVLHLLGFGDKTVEEKDLMRAKENEYILLVKNY